MEKCECECDAQQCLDLVSNEDKTCEYLCACEADIACTGNSGNAAGNCEDNLCPTCTNSTQCDEDQDCIIPPGNSDGNCVDFDKCTSGKTAVCDQAYQVVAGDQNNRAKCCPGTSGCISKIFGVTATSTCGNKCGVSCLGSEKNPNMGNPGSSPTTFCAFGTSVQNFRLCTEIVDLGVGELGCDDGSGTGNNTSCCTDTTGATNMPDEDGEFHCAVPGYGCNSNATGVIGVCVDYDALTNKNDCGDRKVPLCNTSIADPCMDLTCSDIPSDLVDFP